MDLVRELKEVRFELALRGYDCEAVDSFLARLRGEVAAVQSQIDEANERIETLSAQVSDGGGGGSSETEGTLRRTLVLAQRLADETEADAKLQASELINNATTEANELQATAEAEAKELRAAAEADASSMRETGETELSEARDEAEALRTTAAEESSKARVDARQQAQRILDQAELSGNDRVIQIEQAAQEEAASMREPIRAEVVELEGVRSQLLTDISALETHLEDQRVRVKTAVEALRVGMSGSIQDLERVADDDELLATQPAPEHSGATGETVDVAPDIEIQEGVEEIVAEPPAVDDVEEVALAGYVSVAGGDETTSGDDVPNLELVDTPDETDEVLLGDVDSEVVTEEDDDRVVPLTVLEDPSVEDAQVIDDPFVDHTTSVEPEVAAIDTPVTEIDDGGPATEPIPIVATEADDDANELVVLDDEPTGMFGTEVVDDPDPTVTPLIGSETDAEGGSTGTVAGGVVTGAVAAGAATAAVSSANETVATDDSESASDVSFIDRFGAALDEVPIARS